jgi:uncharacterized membrane protein (UPF0127 family)
MRTLISFLALAVCFSFTGCGSGDQVSVSADGIATREVTLPDGYRVVAEIKVTAADLTRGMMYRTELAPDRGMLFVHSVAKKYPYWMANCKIPLDIVWMNLQKEVVEISANTPPCPSGGQDCPTYGGNFDASWVLELGGGEAAKHKVAVGSRIQF